MNERIKELAKQAGFAMKIDDDPNSPPGWWGAGHDPTFEKFAELIIQECIAQVKLEQRNMSHLLTSPPQNAGVWDGCNNIRRHFGVK